MKVLCITCDNASNNLVMIRELEFELDGYGGEAGHARCFLHTTNLVAKSLLRAFEVKKGFRFEEREDELTADEERLSREIRELSSGGDDDDEVEGVLPVDVEAGPDEATDDDDTEGLEDEAATLSHTERKELQRCIRPVQLALAKVNELLQRTSYDQTDPTDTKTKLQDHQFHHETVARVAAHPRGLERSRYEFAARRPYKMEFDFRYASVCFETSRSDRYNYPEEGNGVETMRVS